MLLNKQKMASLLFDYATTIDFMQNNPDIIFMEIFTSHMITLNRQPNMDVDLNFLSLNKGKCNYRGWS